MSTKALDISRGDTVFVRFAIPGSSDRKNIIKEAKVVSTVKRGARVQVVGDNLARHMPWNSIALRAEDFESRPVEEPEAEPEVVEESEPSAMEEEVTSFDKDLNEWMAIGDDMVSNFLAKRDKLKEEREELEGMIAELEERKQQIDYEVEVLGRRINKAMDLLKTLREE